VVRIFEGLETIAAIATSPAAGAVGIVRLSGPAAIDVADQVFLAKNKKSLLTQKSYTLRYGWIVSDKALVKPNVVDEVVVSVMRAPRSYTREDVVEINAHGGPKALSLILELVLENGARLAEPGEFTQRAFLNGRLDLAQAEAVLDIIQAQSELALKNSLAQLSGEVSRLVRDLRSRMIELLADMEAEIDFPEDVCAGSQDDCSRRLLVLIEQLKALIRLSSQGRLIREGLKVAIYGKPNVGKSSLLNSLLKQARAIVTPIAGTTRDTIEECLNIQGLTVRLIDTAGISECRDEIEKEAVARSRRLVRECDLLLFVVDGSAPLTQQDRKLAGQVCSKRCLVLVNKSDLPSQINSSEVVGLFSKEPIRISAKTGRNISELKDEIFNTVFSGALNLGEGVMISNMRHIEILKRSCASLMLASDSLKQGLSLDLAALDCRKGLEVLGELTGETFSEDLLGVIFSKFCVGK
jgi:tRNA modification GTPase